MSQCARWCLMLTSIAVFGIAMHRFGMAPALAQSSGSGGGSFSNAFLIPTVACSAGSFDPSTLTCDKTGGGAKVLFGTIKTPSAANKYVLVMATLESSILTNTLVASKNGQNSTSSAMGSVIVTPATLCNAVEDALAPFGVHIYEQHLPPARILELVGVVDPES